MQILDWVKKQTGKIADNVKDYKFYVKNEPNFIDSSTTLILTPYTNRDQLENIPCIYKWSRIRNGLVAEVPEFRGNSFICEPNDIGSIIQAEVTSTDSAHPGTAILKYGPVKLDVLTKRQVQHALNSGSSVINVDLIQKDQLRECQLKITEDNIRISHCNSSLQYTFDYSMGEPRIEASIKQPTKALIYFSERYDNEVTKFTSSLFGFQDLTESLRLSNEKRLELKFQTRAIKDNFLLIVKAFNTKKAIKTSAVVGKLQKIDLSGDQNFDLMLQIESLRGDLIKLARLNDRYQVEKRVCYEENRRLEKQIEEIIVTYTKIAEARWRDERDLDQSVMELREKKDQVMERKLNKLLVENEALKEKIHYLSMDAGRSQSYNGEQANGMNKFASMGSECNSPMTQSRGGFIKKRQTTEAIPVSNPFQNILAKLEDEDGKDYKVQVRAPQDEKDEKSMLVKELNKSVIKIAKLEQKVKELKMNQTMQMGLEINNISMISASEPDKKLNYTALQLGSEQREKFCAEIEELRRKNRKLRQENNMLKSEIPMISSQTERLNASEANKSQNLDQSRSIKSARSSMANPQAPKISSRQLDKQLLSKIQQLTKENTTLKQHISTLTLQKQSLIKQKSALQQKYRKKLDGLSEQNSMYKRNQDALNRSQNLSMEMESYNEEQMAILRQQNELLASENIKITKLHQRALEELKQIPRLKEQILGLTAELAERKKSELAYSKSHDDINLLSD